jgi:hypothetical protein
VITLLDQDKPEEAASMMKEVLEKRRRILGGKHLDIISAMGGLATILASQYGFEEAETMIYSGRKLAQKIA